jgi:hypothetical protein
MPVPERRKSRNIRYSIQAYVEDNFATPNSYSNQINYGDRTFDPSGLGQWVEVDFLSQGAGRKDFTMVQFTVCSRIGGGRHASDDRFADELDRVTDLLHDAMHTDRIQIYDYSSSKTSPTLVTNAVLVVKNSGGTFREPEEDQTLDPEDGVMRRVLTYMFMHVEDASGASQYYD